MSNVVSDVLSLLLAIQRWNRQIDKSTALLLRMREDNRTLLTDEEWQTLQAGDNEARQALVEAIERREQEG